MDNQPYELFTTHRQYNLSDLITKLKEMDQDYVFEGISGLDSYRGYYSELAIELESGCSMSVAELLKEAKEAIGKEFTGYKGGEYIMQPYTEIYLSWYGMASGFEVIDIKDGKFIVQKEG